MKTDPSMPFAVRCWLWFSSSFAFVIRVFAKRMHARQGLDADRFAERLGVACAPRAEGRRIWIHAASLGEVGQIAPLVAELQDTNTQVIVTTVTATGAQWVAQNLPQAVHQFLPLDTPQATRQFLDHWSPAMAIFIEADIWPRLVLEAAARDIPLALVNARPSKSRARAPKTYHYLLSHFFAITCKSAEVRAGLRALGLGPEKLHLFGDLRAAIPTLPTDPIEVASLQAQIGSRPVWIAASTHAEDEAQVLTACQNVLTQHPKALLIWAPRHPTRAPQIMEAAGGLTLHRRSTGAALTDQTQIYLADTTGELGTFFACSDIVFLGGSFGPQGGHNPYEPAGFGCYMLTGPNVQNHKDAFAALLALGAAETVTDGAALAHSINNLFATGQAAEKGARAATLMATSDKATAQTAALIKARVQG